MVKKDLEDETKDMPKPKLLADPFECEWRKVWSGMDYCGLPSYKCALRGKSPHVFTVFSYSGAVWQGAGYKCNIKRIEFIIMYGGDKVLDHVENADPERK